MGSETLCTEQGQEIHCVGLVMSFLGLCSAIGNDRHGLIVVNL